MNASRDGFEYKNDEQVRVEITSYLRVNLPDPDEDRIIDLAGAIQRLVTENPEMTFEMSKSLDLETMAVSSLEYILRLNRDLVEVKTSINSGVVGKQMPFYSDLESKLSMWEIYIAGTDIKKVKEVFARRSSANISGAVSPSDIFQSLVEKAKLRQMISDEPEQSVSDITQTRRETGEI